MKKKIGSPHVPDPPPQTWSNCLVVGNQVFVAGMVARGSEGAVGGDDRLNYECGHKQVGRRWLHRMVR